MRLAELLQYGARELRMAGVEEFDLDARLLLEEATGRSRTEIFLYPDHEVPPDSQELFEIYISKRANREPVAYIIGSKEFWSMGFHVNSSVLIPRPETEFLLEQVFLLSKTENWERGKILDLCCGSGAIAIVLAKEKGKSVIASDISWKTLETASSNICKHQLKSTIELVQGDLLGPFASNPRFSLIVSNPPYVSRYDVHNTLEPEVAKFEPHLALDGGEDGLDLVYRIYRDLPSVLMPGGELFMEIGSDQGDAVKKMFSTAPESGCDFDCVDILRDYSGRERIAHIIRKLHHNS